MVDKAYVTEIIKQTFTEETTALQQIPVKTRQKSVTYKSNVEQYSDHKYTDSKTK